MQLMDLIQHKHKIISVVGMAKNAGKTMTMNQLIDEAMEKSIRIGITSTGRDGEKLDIVTNTEKPLIYVDSGTLMATTEKTLGSAEAKLEILEVTDFHTSMGKIVIVQAKTSGYVEIAGPSTTMEVKAVSEKLLGYGAELVIVDGALDRIASAAPGVTEATILATGAVLSRSMDQVIEKSLHQIELFNLRAVGDPLIKFLAENSIEQKKCAMIDDQNQIEYLEIKTALSGGAIIGGAIQKNTRYVVIGGSLVSATLKRIIEGGKKYKEVTFIVKDATRVFIDAKDWMYFKRAGISIMVINPMKPLAVTVNPYAPQGYYFDPEELLMKMTKFLSPIPVFDVVLGGEQ